MRLLSLLALLLIVTWSSANAAVDPKEQCLAGPRKAPGRPFSVRSATVVLNGVAASQSLTVAICIDAANADPVRANMGLFASNGRLVAMFGQPADGSNSSKNGAITSTYFNSGQSTLGLDLAHIADRLLLQVTLSDADPNPMYSVMASATFSGMAAVPFQAIAPGTCLSPATSDSVEIRDASLTWSTRDPGYDVHFCAVSPRKARLTEVHAAVRLLTDVPDVPNSLLRETSKIDGNGVSNFHSLSGAPKGTPAGMPRSVAMLGVTLSALPNVTQMSAPYPVAIMELRDIRTCTGASASTCALDPKPVVSQGTVITDRGNTQ